MNKKQRKITVAVMEAELRKLVTDANVALMFLSYGEVGQARDEFEGMRERLDLIESLGDRFGS
jgi:hypothetical protein